MRKNNIGFAVVTLAVVLSGCSASRNLNNTVDNTAAESKTTAVAPAAREETETVETTAQEETETVAMVESTEAEAGEPETVFIKYDDWYREQERLIEAGEYEGDPEEFYMHPYMIYEDSYAEALPAKHYYYPPGSYFITSYEKADEE